jgi:DNA modification methylase
MIKDTIQRNENTAPNGKQLAVLKEHFPGCFRADGSFDLERFKAEIADDTRVTQESYELKFLGKSYAKLLASADTTTILLPDETHNSLPDNAGSENIYISGDNLDGLKHLLKSYQGAVKCIYIDPPYNTGSDGFVYFDNFNYTKETLQEKLNVGEEEAGRILELTRRGSASHSAWLMFMYSRLLLARDLLATDGVIFISIDDNEQANLKLLCDDVFGEENFVGNVIWERAFAPKNDAKYFSSSHDHILVYSKYIEDFEIGNLDRNSDMQNRYKNTDNDSRGAWTSGDLSVKTYSEKYDYPIVTPSGRIVYPPHGACWRVSKEKYEQLVLENRIWFGEDGNNVPRLKRFLSEVQDGVVPTTIWYHKDVGHNQEGRQELKKLFNDRGVFDGPKPIRLLHRILKIANISVGDLILDFFSGSATTAHAVMQLNAEDGGRRKFIAVQLPEALSPEVDSQKTACDFLREHNLPLTLDYIGMERIRRAAVKIRAENPDKQLDLGFRHFTLAEPNQNTLDKLERFDAAALLADTTIMDDFGKPAILATWLNADGYGMTSNAQAIDLAGYTAYYCKKHLYLIDSGFSLDSMKALLGKYDTEGTFNPENLVIFGYSFPEWSINEMIEKNLRILNDTEKNLKINFSVRY